MCFGQIIYDEQSCRLRLNGKKIHCGTMLDVAIEDSELHWVPTKVIINSDLNYSFEGLEQYPVAGMFARTDDPYFD